MKKTLTLLIAAGFISAVGINTSSAADVHLGVGIRFGFGFGGSDGNCYQQPAQYCAPVAAPQVIYVQAPVQTYVAPAPVVSQQNQNNACTPAQPETDDVTPNGTLDSGTSYAPVAPSPTYTYAAPAQPTYAPAYVPAPAPTYYAQTYYPLACYDSSYSVNPSISVGLQFGGGGGYRGYAQQRTVYVQNNTYYRPVPVSTGWHGGGGFNGGGFHGGFGGGFNGGFHGGGNGGGFHGGGNSGGGYHHN